MTNLFPERLWRSLKPGLFRNVIAHIIAKPVTRRTGFEPKVLITAATTISSRGSRPWRAIPLRGTRTIPRLCGATSILLDKGECRK